jgi:hypothetical protein
MNTAKFIEYSSVFGNSGLTRAHPGALREGQSSTVEQLQRFAMILTRANHGFMTLAQPF